MRDGNNGAKGGGHRRIDRASAGKLVVTHDRRGLGLATALVIGAPGVAWPQDTPSFDCARARTHVEHVLCSGGNAGMGWIDRTMADLYGAASKRAGADAGALRSAQRAWLASRDRCAGSDADVMNCLNDSYRNRFRAIAAPYDARHVTGQYAADPINGFLDAVLFPDGTLAAHVTASLGAPSYNNCDIVFRAPLSGGHLHDAMPTDPGGDPNAQPCTIDLTATGRGMELRQANCDSECGYGVQIAGDYKPLKEARSRGGRSGRQR